ncbi:MAG: hypothetical protein ABI870_10515 [Rhodanobacter sp.]
MRASLAAIQWRLLLLWTLVLWLPTAVVGLPLWSRLGELLDHSVNAQAWAAHFSPLMFGDTVSAMSDETGWFHGVAMLGLLLTALLMPFLNGMLVGSGRAGRALGFSHLLQSGIVEYGRMFRLMLWSLLPYLIFGGLAVFAFNAADKVGEHAVLESKSDSASHMVVWLAVVLILLAQAIVESARAAFIADSGLRSATRALGRGFMQLLRRPLSTLLCMVMISLIGYAIAMALGVLRAHSPAISVGGTVLAIVLTQMVVMAIGWTHVARVFSLAEVARSLPGSRRGSGLPPAM